LLVSFKVPVFGRFGWNDYRTEGRNWSQTFAKGRSPRSTGGPLFREAPSRKIAPVSLEFPSGHVLRDAHEAMGTVIE
jgi:hypothetical protein